jgi:hypothetical protein
MTKNVIVNAENKDNAMGLLKKFTQKMRSSGVVQRVKSIRYNERDLSAFKNKSEKMRKMEKLDKKERAIKLGKKPEGRR